MKYVVHKNGKVFTFKNGKYKEKKSTTSRNNYPKVGLYSNGLGKWVLVHRLIAKGYLKNPKNKKCVNHKNGVKTDNSIENLEWSTHQENTIHSFKTGLQKDGNRGGCISWDSYEKRWAGDITHKGNRYRKVSKNKLKIKIWMKNTLAGLEK